MKRCPGYLALDGLDAAQDVVLENLISPHSVSSEQNRHACRPKSQPPGPAGGVAIFRDGYRVKSPRTAQSWNRPFHISDDDHICGHIDTHGERGCRYKNSYAS